MKLKLVISVLMVIAALSFSCEREEVLGPQIEITTGDVKLKDSLFVNQSFTNFDLGGRVWFSANFEESANWNITIVGKVSGAQKIISGYSQQIDSTNSVWNGVSDAIFFKKEACVAKLRIGESNEVIDSVSISILATRIHEGVVLANMETEGATSSCWFPNGGQILCNPNYFFATPLEGTFAHNIQGQSVGGDNFIGLGIIGLTPGVNTNGNHFISETSNADSLYFNIFIYGTGDSNPSVLVKFLQDDNDDGSHNANSENGMEYWLEDLSHIGWKKFSFPYSDVVPGDNPNFGGNGDGFLRPDKIVAVELGLWAFENTTVPVELTYDYVTLTYGKPFAE